MKLWQLFLIALFLWLPSAVFSPPNRQQELRVLISARNMLESGNFHRPEFQKQPRFRKPPMAYWLAAAGMAITGNRSSAWAGRIFFVLSSLCGIGLLIKIAGPAGFHTALIALFSFGYLRFAPLAETDMIQLSGILLFFYAWQRQASLLAGLGISFACLSKGPGGILIPLLCLGILLRFYRPEKKFILAVLLIPLILIGGWIIYLMSQISGLDQMQKDLTATFINSNHRNPWYYYFYTLPLLMIPGGLLIFCKPDKNEQNSPIELGTALAWLGVSLALLMLTVSKQRHYALLLIPPSAWLIGMRIQSRKLPRPWILILASGMIGGFITFYELQTEDYAHAAFLSAARPLVKESPTVHVVGINSAIFDYHLGRHVENTTSAVNALARANPGDTVAVIQKQGKTLPKAEPVLSENNEKWVRALYIKQEDSSVLDITETKRD